MKNQLIRLLVCFSVLITSHSAFAQREGGAVGTRGGGDVIPFQGRFGLSDLYDQTACQWKSMEPITSNSPEVQKLLGRISRKHPYLAFQLKRIFSDLTICFSNGTLKKLDSKDSIMVTVNGQRKQVAVRVSDYVYIDQKIFKTLPAKEQALLFVHEASHSLLPWGTDDRPAKLRSFVYMLNRIESYSLTDMLLNIDSNQFSIGWVNSGFWPALQPVIDKNEIITTRVNQLRKLLSVNKNFTPNHGCFTYPGNQDREKNHHLSKLVELLLPVGTELQQDDRVAISFVYQVFETVCSTD